MTRKSLKRIIALLLTAIVFVNVCLVGGSANTADANASTPTVLSANSESLSNIYNQELDILHVEKKVYGMDEDYNNGKYGQSGFDVEITAYLDELAKAKTPLDIMFVTDGSNSMLPGERKQAVNAIEAIIEAFYDSTAGHRFGLVCYSALVDEVCTLDRMYSGDEIYSKSSGLHTDWSSALSTYRVSVLVDDWSTDTDLGLERANKLLSANKKEGRKQVVILLTDGEPTDWMVPTDNAANRTLQQASLLKQKGVLIFTVEMFYEAKDASRAAITNKYTSSAYGPEAVDVNKTYNAHANSKFWVFKANNLSGLIDSMSKVIVNATLYPFVLDDTAILQDVVTEYFDISNAACKIYKPSFNQQGQIYDWTHKENATVNIDGQRVWVTGFDYIDRLIATDNATDAAKIVLTYHITPKENFLGGQRIPTMIQGSVRQNAWTAGGSGIYCSGKFIKGTAVLNDKTTQIFDYSHVHVLPQGNPVNVPEETIVPYNTEVDLNDLVEFQDFTSEKIDGINNTFVQLAVDIIETEYPDYGGDGKTEFLIKINPRQKLDNAAINILPKYPITSYKGDEYYYAYYITYAHNKDNVSSEFELSNACNNKYNSNGVISVNTGRFVIKTNTLFNVDFKYVDMPEELISLIPTPEKITGIQGADTDNRISQVKPQLGTTGEEMGLTGYDLLFTGWVYESQTEEIDGSITLHYEGKWVADGYLYVNTYIEDYYTGNYPEKPNESFGVPAKIGTQANMITELSYKSYPQGFNAYPWLYYFDNGSSVSLENDILKNNAELFTNDVNHFNGHCVSYVTDSGATKTIKSKNGASLFSTIDCYFCNGCGSVLTNEGKITKSGDLVTWDCPKCQKTTTGIHYSDYELDTDASTTSLTISADLSKNTINLYFKKCKHDVTLNITDLDTGEVSSFTSTNYSDVYTDSSGFADDYVDFAFFDKEFWIYNSLKPYYDFKPTGISGCYSGLFFGDEGFIPASETSEWFTDYWINTMYCPDDIYTFDMAYNDALSYFIGDVFEIYSFTGGGSSTEYDVTFNATIERSKYDLQVEKSWSSAVQDKDKQSCVFTLYEVDELGSYIPVTTFAIGVNETSKTISGLYAGKTYVLEEESWSYKTESGMIRGAENETRFICENVTEDRAYDTDAKFWLLEYYYDTVPNLTYLGSDNPTLSITCTNSADESWSGGQTVDKGVVNSLDNAAIICTPIIKKQEG